MPAPPDRKTLIAKMKAAAKRLGKPHVTQAEFRRLTGIGPFRVKRIFGSHGELLQATGLMEHAPSQRIPDDALLRAMAETFRQEKGLVTYDRFKEVGRHSIHVYWRRWGSWSAALLAFRQWQAQYDPDFPYADQFARLRLRGGAALGRSPVWKTLGGRHYGETLNFRGLLHSPVNEQGVVFLFATLAVELGFLIESLTSEFPDCEAKRRVGRVWERVRIEFEYESRNFRRHRHDPKGCDLIVCWEHNWPQCPLGVLELKTVVAAGSLKGSGPGPSSPKH